MATNGTTTYSAPMMASPTNYFTTSLATAQPALATGALQQSSNGWTNVTWEPVSQAYALIRNDFMTSANINGGGNISWPTCQSVSMSVNNFPTPVNATPASLPLYVQAWKPGQPPAVSSFSSDSFGYTSPWPAGSSMKLMVHDSSFRYSTATLFVPMVDQGGQDCSTDPVIDPYMNLAFAPGSDTDCSDAVLLLGADPNGRYDILVSGDDGAAVFPDFGLPSKLQFDPNQFRDNYWDDITGAPLGPEITQVWLMVRTRGSTTYSTVLDLGFRWQGNYNCSVTIAQDPSQTALITPTAAASSTSSSKPPTGTIVGAVVAAIVGLALGALLSICFYRRGRRRAMKKFGVQIPEKDPSITATSPVETSVSTDPFADTQAMPMSATTGGATLGSHGMLTPISPVRYVQHTDAYATLGPEATSEGSIVDLPPVYANHSRLNLLPGRENDDGISPTASALDDFGMGSSTEKRSPTVIIRQPRLGQAKGWAPPES